MRDILNDIDQWLSEGKQVAIATVVQAYGSALRGAGGKMAISSNSDISGSVSGGCVEGAVVMAAQEVLQTGIPKFIEFGIADETAWTVGLTCGGSIQVFVEKLDAAQSSIYDMVKTCIQKERLAVLATVLNGSRAGKKLLSIPGETAVDNLENPNLRAALSDPIQEILASQDSRQISLELQEGTSVNVFLDVFPPLSRLIIVGAVHIAIPLVTLAKTIGFHTIVVDARSAFATPSRFPHPDELILSWPSEFLEKIKLDEGCYVVIITHDDKIDVPALAAALKSKARYIGVLGSRKTQARRVKALEELGYTPSQLARLHSPIGLNIGAKGPEEIALSIIAEIVSAKHGIN